MVANWREYTVINPAEFAAANFNRFTPKQLYGKKRRINAGNVATFIQRELKSETRTRYTTNILAARLRIEPHEASAALSFLNKQGYLSASPRSAAAANAMTELLWEMLFRPIGILAATLDTNNVPELHKQQEWYAQHPEHARADRQWQLESYDLERTSRGVAGGEENRRILLSLLSDNEEWKQSKLREEVNRQRETPLSDSGVRTQLEHLMKSGSVVQPKRGYYQRALPADQAQNVFAVAHDF